MESNTTKLKLLGILDDADSSSAATPLAAISKWFRQLSIAEFSKESPPKPAVDRMDEEEDWRSVPSEKREKSLREEEALNANLRSWVASTPLSVALTGPQDSSTHQRTLLNTLLEATADRGYEGRGADASEEKEAPAPPEHAMDLDIPGGSIEDEFDVKWLTSDVRRRPVSAPALNLYGSTRYEFEGDGEGAAVPLPPPSSDSQSIPSRGFHVDSLFGGSTGSMEIEQSSPAIPRVGTPSHGRRLQSGRAVSRSGPQTYSKATAYVWDEPSTTEAERKEYSWTSFSASTLDQEFLLDEAFIASWDWDRERLAASSSPSPDRGFPEDISLEESRSFFLPGAGRVADPQELAQTFHLRFGEIPSLIVSFPTEQELRLSLWKIHEIFVNPTLMQDGAVRPLLPALAARYCKLLGIPTSSPALAALAALATAPLPLAALPFNLVRVSSPHDFVFPDDVSRVLGRNFQFRGRGLNFLHDRVFIREKLKDVIRSYAAFLPRFLLRIPCSVLAGNKEIVEVSPGAVLADLHAQLALSHAHLLMVAVDERRGIAPEVAASLRAAGASEKLLGQRSSQHSAIFLNFGAEERRETPLEATRAQESYIGEEFRSKLLQQFRALLLESQRASPSPAPPPGSSTAVDRVIADSLVLSAHPSLFSTIHLREDISPELMGDLDARRVLSATSVPTILSAIPNRQLLLLSSDLKALHRSLLKDSPIFQLQAANQRDQQQLIKTQHDLGKAVSAVGAALTKTRSDLLDAMDQLKILLRLKGRDQGKELQRALSPLDHFVQPQMIFEHLQPVAECALSSWDRLVASSAGPLLQALHGTVNEAFGALESLLRLLQQDLSTLNPLRNEMTALFQGISSTLLLGVPQRLQEAVRGTCIAVMRETMMASPSLTSVAASQLLARIADRLQEDMGRQIAESLQRFSHLEKAFGDMIKANLQPFKDKLKRRNLQAPQGTPPLARSHSASIFASPPEMSPQDESPEESESEMIVASDDGSLSQPGSRSGSMDADSASLLPGFPSPSLLSPSPTSARSSFSGVFSPSDPSMDLADFHDLRPLLALLQRSHLKIHPVERDGNSQFRALAVAVYGQEAAYGLVRLLIVNEILQHRATYEPLLRSIHGLRFPPSLEEYCATMSKDHCQGDQLTLIAFSNFYGADISVYSIDQAHSGQPQLIQSSRAALPFAPRPQLQPLLIAFLGEGVFQPVFPASFDLRRERRKLAAKQSKTTEPAKPPKVRSVPFLSDLCIVKVVAHIHACPPIGHLLPADVLQRLIAAVCAEKKLSDRTLGPLLSSRLASLTLHDRLGSGLSDNGIYEIARNCHQLQRFELINSWAVTGRSLAALLASAPLLDSLAFRQCANVTPILVQEIARKCPRLTSLDLSGCVQIGDSAIQELLLACPSLTALTLCALPLLTDAAFAPLPKTLTALDLSDSDAVTGQFLVSLSANCPDLRLLRLGARQLTDLPLVSLVKASPSPSLTVLEIPGCAALTNAALFAIAYHCRSLEVLNLEGARSIDDSAFGVQAGFGTSDAPPLLSFPALRSLNLSRAPPLQPESFRRILSTAPKLRHLILNGSEGLTDDHFRVIADLAPKLKSFVCTKAPRLTDGGGAHLAMRLNKLKRLELQGEALSDTSLAPLIERNKQIQHLALPSTQAGDLTLSKIARLHFLTHLDLTEANAVTSEGLSALKYLPQLKTLKVAHLRAFGDRALEHVINACQSLTELDISYCAGIYSDVWSSNFLLAFPHLQTLNLRGYPHPLPGLSHPFLETLILSWCPGVDDETLGVLASHCPALVHLDLAWSSKVSSNAVHRLALSLPHLRTLSLRGCARVSPMTIQYLAHASHITVYR